MASAKSAQQIQFAAVTRNEAVSSDPFELKLRFTAHMSGFGMQPLSLTPYAVAGCIWKVLSAR